MTPEGPNRFGHTICDVYDESMNEAILLNGCYWLAVRDSPLHLAAKLGFWFLVNFIIALQIKL